MSNRFFATRRTQDRKFDFSSFDLSTQLFLKIVKQSGGTISYDQAYATDVFVRTLKTKNLWNILPGMYPYLGQTANSAKINLKTPGTGDIVWTAGGAFYNAWGVNISGIATPSNQGGIIDLLPSTTFSALNNFSFGCFPVKLDNSNNGAGYSNSFDMGCFNGTNSAILCVNSFGNSNAAQPSFVQCGQVNARYTKTWASQTAMPFGLYSLVRSASAVQLYVDGTSQVSGSSNLANCPDLKLGVLGYNDQGTTRQGTMRGQAFAYVANRALTAQELSDLSDAVWTYVFAKMDTGIYLQGSSIYNYSYSTNFGSMVKRPSATKATQYSSGTQFFNDSAANQIQIVPFAQPYSLFQYPFENYVYSLSANNTNLTNVMGKNCANYSSLNVSNNNLNAYLDLQFCQSLINLDLKNNANLQTTILSDSCFQFVTGEDFPPTPVNCSIAGTPIETNYDIFQSFFNQNAFRYLGDMVYPYTNYNYYRAFIGNAAYYFDTTTTASENHWMFVYQAQQFDTDAENYIVNMGNNIGQSYINMFNQMAADQCISALKSNGFWNRIARLFLMMPDDISAAMVDAKALGQFNLNYFGGYLTTAGIYNNAGGGVYLDTLGDYGLSYPDFFAGGWFLCDQPNNAADLYQALFGTTTIFSSGNDDFYVTFSQADAPSPPYTYTYANRIGSFANAQSTTDYYQGYPDGQFIFLNSTNSQGKISRYDRYANLLDRTAVGTGTQTYPTSGYPVALLGLFNSGGPTSNNPDPGVYCGVFMLATSFADYEIDALSNIFYNFNSLLGR